MLAGIVRDWRGSAAALFAAWFGVPAAIALAVIAAVLLGAIGYVGGVMGSGDVMSDVPIWGEVLNPTASRVGGGAGALLGIIGGLLAGGLAGLALPWLATYSNDPMITVLVALFQVVIAIVIGCLYTLYAIAFEPLRLRLGGARRLSRREAEFLLPIMHDCAYRLGLRNVPRLLIDDTREANAFAYARHIVISRGILDEFDYDEVVLAGLLSHELTHWRNADGVARLFVRGLALPLYLPYAAATWVLRTFQNSFVRFVAGLVAWPIAAAVRFLVMPMQAAGSREAEYRADQGAVISGHRRGLRKTLERFRRSFDGARNGWDAAICATHPPNELRLEAIERPGREYLLPAERRKTRAEASQRQTQGPPDPDLAVTSHSDGGRP